MKKIRAPNSYGYTLRHFRYICIVIVHVNINYKIRSIMKPQFSVFLFLCFSLLLSAQSAPIHNWLRTNPGGGGAFATVGAGPTGQIIVGSDLGGAYYSWTGGQNWYIYGAERGLTSSHVSAVGFHPTNENIFYLGTDAGIFRSGNGGGSLNNVLAGGYVTDIHVATQNTNIVYAAYHPDYDSAEGEIYKSTNNGLTWMKVDVNLPAGLRLLKIRTSPFDANTVYVLSGKGRFACSEAEVYRSTNGGASWTHLTASVAPVLDFSLHPTQAGKLYLTTMNAGCSEAFYWTNTDGAFYESTNAGSNWNWKANRTGVIWIKNDQPTVIRMIDPREPFPWKADAGTWESSNGGITWARTGMIADWNTAYQDTHFWSYGTAFDGITKTLGQAMYNSSDLFWVNSQWVYGTYNNGETFNALHTNEQAPGWWQSTGIDNVVMYDLEINEADPQVIYAGYWDIGFWRSLDGGNSWQNAHPEAYSGGWGDSGGGNVTTIVSDPNRGNVVWASLQGNNGETAFLVKNTQYGAKDQWQLSNTGLPVTSSIFGLSVDRTSPASYRKLFVTVNGDIYRSTNDGASWAMVLNNDNMRFTAVDHFNGNWVYAGGEGGFWRSSNGGNTWAETGETEMRGSIAGDIRAWGWEGVFDICVDPQQSGRVYVAATGAGKGLYRSDDYGQTWVKLLADDYMRAVVVSAQDQDKIYAGSSSAHFAGGYNPNSNGVLYSEDGGQNWDNINHLMPYPFALTLDISRADPELVFVGSPGSGFQYAPVGGNAIYDCHENILQLDQFSILSGNYRAIQSIESSGSVLLDNNVIMKAGQEILLNPGFEVKPYGTFEADIEPCSVPVNQDEGGE